MPSGSSRFTCPVTAKTSHRAASTASTSMSQGKTLVRQPSHAELFNRHSSKKSAGQKESPTLPFDPQPVQSCQRICKLKRLLNLIFFPPLSLSGQGGQGSPGGPGQHSGQDHSLCHRRLLPDDPGAHVAGGEGHLEPHGHRDQARAK